MIASAQPQPKSWVITASTAACQCKGGHEPTDMEWKVLHCVRCQTATLTKGSKIYSGLTPVLLEKQQNGDVLKGQLLYVAKNEYNKFKLVVATPRKGDPSCALVILDPNTDSLRGKRGSKDLHATC